MHRFLATMLMCAFAFTAPVQAAQAAPEMKFIEGVGQKALSVLADSSLSKEQSLAAFKQLFNSNFDLQTIAKFTLGRYWRVATPSEQEEYLRLFRAMVEKIYTDRFSLYSGETFEVVSARPDAENDTVVLSQVVRPQGPPVNVEWRVRKQGKAMKIVDVVVEGVSMSVTQRAEFASVIQRGGGTVESLLAVMRQRAAQPVAALPGKS
ncbi:MAG: phospholipid-binding protein MlaC [Bdellovibrionales bacterium]